VKALHRVPISTISAQAGPSAESGLTGPGLRELAEVSVKATARSLRPESLSTKTRSEHRSARRFRDEGVAGGRGYRMGQLLTSDCRGNGRRPACCARRLFNTFPTFAVRCLLDPGPGQ
jgi:hypothetical protein